MVTRKRAVPVRAKPATAEQAGPGRTPTKPLAILYKDGVDSVCAMLAHPKRNQYKLVSATGPYAALGILHDEGYQFGTINKQVPNWAKSRVPEHAIVLGCASIISAPF